MIFILYATEDHAYACELGTRAASAAKTANAVAASRIDILLFVDSVTNPAARDGRGA